MKLILIFEEEITKKINFSAHEAEFILRCDEDNTSEEKINNFIHKYHGYDIIYPYKIDIRNYEGKIIKYEAEREEIKVSNKEESKDEIYIRHGASSDKNYEDYPFKLYKKNNCY